MRTHEEAQSALHHQARPDRYVLDSAGRISPRYIHAATTVIAGAIAKKACSIEVSYDAAPGHPTKVDIDFDPDTAGEELRFSVGDLRPASPPPGSTAPAR